MHFLSVRTGSGIVLPEEVCKRCCDKGVVCPAICDLSRCHPPASGQCPFVDKTRIRCSSSAADTCRSDKSCPRGQRCCDTGCSRNCSPVCRPACGRGRKCIKNTIYCFRAPCPQPAPGCEPVPGQCPFVDKSRILCSADAKDSCRSDRSCPRGQRCCDTGCSRNCSPVCRPACGRGRKCIKNTVFCVRAPCPQPAPTCEPVPGQCPFVDKSRISCSVDAKDTCQSDKSCPKGQRCCDTGCSRNCSPVCRPGCGKDEKCIKKTIFCITTPCPQPAPACEPGIPTPPRIRPGTCPQNDASARLSCAKVPNQAQRPPKCNDANCPGKQKCCRYGCGIRCMPPCLPECGANEKCFMKKNPAGVCFGRNCPHLPLLVPKCERERKPENPCSLVDCKSGYGCVVRDGKAKCVRPEVRPGICPVNNIVKICLNPVNSCNSDAPCKLGHKCCTIGCNRKCVAACRKPCRPGKECRLMHVRCRRPPCRSFSSCVVRRGTCPRPRKDSLEYCSAASVRCKTDTDCKYGSKCCNGGCGLRCMPINLRG